MRELLLTALLTFFLAGCKDNPDRRHKTAEPSDFIFHPFLFQEEMHTQVHIPYWFSSSVIGEARIRQIVRLTYATLESDPDKPETRETFPKLKTVYTFSPEGRLVMLEEIHFADGLEISRRSYSIDEVSDNSMTGVSMQGETTDNFDEETEGFVLFSEMTRTPNKLDLREARDSRRHIFVLDKKYWGGLSVDSISHPGPRDWIVLGKPQKPLKRYQVKNTVTESNVTRYSYVKSNYPRTITWSDYPFSQRRSFRYDNGKFSGFTDSTFMDHSYITRTVTSFSLNKQGFPVKVIRRSDKTDDKSEFSAVEIFKYIRFTSDL